MKRDFLEGLGITDKDIIDKVMSENGKDIESAKSVNAETAKELELLREQLETANKEIESYKDMNIEEIKQKAEDWELKVKDLEETLTATKQEALLDKNLATINTHDTDVLKKMLNIDELIYEEDSIKGLTEQIEALRESKSYLFKQQQEENNDIPGLKSHTIEEGSDTNISDMAATIESVFNN